MEKQIWVTSDTHFFHTRVIEFSRPQYSCVEEMNEDIIRKWNDTVQFEDTVYHLGDFAFGSDLEKIERLIQRLNGKIKLILGNHDTQPKIELYRKYFKIMVSSKISDDGVIMTHYPVHEIELNYGNKINIHGHTHLNTIKDPRYKNASWDNGFRLFNYKELVK